MPGIYRRPDSPFWWIWFQQDGRRIMRSSRTKSKTQAYAELNSILLRLKRGERVIQPPSSSSIEQDLLRTLSDQESSGRKSPYTAARDYVRLQAFFRYAAAHDIRCVEDIDARVLQHFLTWLPATDNRISPVTANRYVDAVRGLLPFKVRVTKNRENESSGKEIPQEVFQQILDQADLMFRAFLILLAETGLRTGHLAMVETSWIRSVPHQNGGITSVPASEASRRHKKTGPVWVLTFPPDRFNSHKRAPQIPLSPLAIQIITSMNRHPRVGGDPGSVRLFPTYTSNRVHELWRQIRKRLGHDYRPHDIRHTFAIRELLRTGNPAYVQRMLGHSTPMTTMRIYQQLSLLRMTDLVAGANPSGIKKLP